MAEYCGDICRAPAALQLAHLLAAGITWVLLVLTAEHVACVAVRTYPISATVSNDKGQEVAVGEMGNLF